MLSSVNSLIIYKFSQTKQKLGIILEMYTLFATFSSNKT